MRKPTARSSLRASSLLALAVAASGAIAAPATTPMPQLHRSAATAALGLPFSDAARVGELLFVSGQIGNLPGQMQLAPGGIEAETRQAMENIKAILAASGSSLEQVAKCTVFLADIKDWPAFNAVYRGYFPAERLPARSALAASGLALGAKVEVECIAAAD